MMRLCQVIGGATHYMCLVSPSFRARLQLQCVEQSRGKGFWAARLFCWYRPANHLVAQGEGQALLAPALQLLVQISRWCANGASVQGTSVLAAAITSLAPAALLLILPRMAFILGSNVGFEVMQNAICL